MNNLLYKMLFCIGFIFCSFVVTANDNKQSLTLTAQRLPDAIALLSQQINVVVITNAKDADDFISNSIDGEFTPLDALRALIKGLPLRADALESGALVINDLQDDVTAETSESILELRSYDENIEKISIVAKRASQSRSISLGFFGSRDAFSTPYSIQSFSSDDLLVSNLDSLSDFQRLDPTLATSFDSYTVDISARGFPLANESVRLDGAPTGMGVIIPLEFLERTEVLKGANGFLYGFASPGGTINSVTKRPASDFLLNGGLRHTEDSAVRGFVDVSNQLADHELGFRLQGLFENGTEKSRDIDREVTAFHASAVWTPSDNLLIDADYFFQNSKSFGGYAEPIWSLGDPSVSILDPEIVLDNQHKQDWEVLPFDSEAYGASVTYAFSDNWTLQFRFRQSETIQDFTKAAFLIPATDSTFNAFVFSSGTGEKFTLYQGIISGLIDTANVTHEINLVVDNQIFKQSIPLGGTFDFAAFNEPWDSDFVLTEPAIDSIDPFVDAREETQLGAVLSDAMTWNDLTVIAAIRTISYEKEEFLSGLPLVEEDEVLPSLGVLYAFTDAWSAYSSYAENLERGTFTGLLTANPNQQLPPVESQQLEVGVKGVFENDSLFSIALFDLKRDYEYINADNFFVSDGEQHHQGLEVLYKGTFFDSLSVNVGGYWIDADVQDLSNQDDLRPTNIPDFQLSTRLDYRVSSAIRIFGGVFHSSDKELDIPNNRTIDSYTIVDVGGSYTFEYNDTDFTLVAGVQNLFDKAYWQSQFSIGAPRTLTLQLLGSLQ
ncbi:MAG: TonB-dependent siderophore receptor [Pseudomonadota bacterium]